MLPSPAWANCSVRQSLQTVYTRNDAAGLGVANITGLDEQRARDDKFRIHPLGTQTREVLPGINMAFACHAMAAGLVHEGMTILETLHDRIYEGQGLWFRTPAAWTAANRYRASMNLRPLVIWALEYDGERGDPSPASSD